MPSISIIVPTYNAGEYIKQGLESLANQTFQDFEIIVSNDGSTDNTLEVVKLFKSNHHNLKVISITNENGGVSLARKRALEAASCEWITFMDADDSLPPNALSDLWSEVNDETDLIVGFLISPQKEISISNPKQWQEAIINGLIPPTVWGKLFRRRLLLPEMLDIPRNITNGEDALMNIAYVFNIEKPPRFVYSHIYNYTRQPISLSHSTQRTVEYEYVYDKFRLKAIPKIFHKEYIQGFTKYRLNGILGCCQSDTATIAKKEHPFFKIIRDGIKESGYRLSIFEWIVLNSKSPFIIRNSGFLRRILISLRYRIKLLFKRNRSF